MIMEKIIKDIRACIFLIGIVFEFHVWKKIKNPDLKGTCKLKVNIIFMTAYPLCSYAFVYKNKWIFTKS